MLSDPSALAIVLLPPVGFAAGVFGSFTGLGGAVLLTPVLAAGFGLPYPAAITCTLAQMAGMALFGLLRHARLGHVDIRLALSFLSGSVPGALLGRAALHALSARIEPALLRPAFHTLYGLLFVLGSAFLAIKILRFLRERRKNGPALVPVPRLTGRGSRLAATFAGGLGAGFLAGLLAIGGGMVTVPVLVGLLGVPLETAVGTSVLQMIPMAVAATALSVRAGGLDWTFVGLLLVGSIPGSQLGPWLLHRAVTRFRKDQ